MIYLKIARDHQHLGVTVPYMFNVQGALDIIRATTELEQEQQGDEIELDFDKLDAPTLWRLESYLRSLNTAGNGNFHVEV